MVIVGGHPCGCWVMYDFYLMFVNFMKEKIMTMQSHIFNVECAEFIHNEFLDTLYRSVVAIASYLRATPM